MCSRASPARPRLVSVHLPRAHLCSSPFYDATPDGNLKVEGLDVVLPTLALRVPGAGPRGIETLWCTLGVLSAKGRLRNSGGLCLNTTRARARHFGAALCEVHPLIHVGNTQRVCRCRGVLRFRVQNRGNTLLASKF